MYPRNSGRARVVTVSRTRAESRWTNSNVNEDPSVHFSSAFEAARRMVAGMTIYPPAQQTLLRNWYRNHVESLRASGRENVPVQPRSHHGNPAEMKSLEETSSASGSKKENVLVQPASLHGNPAEVRGVEETSSAKKENVPVQPVSRHENPVQMRSLKETSSASKNKKENVRVQPVSRHGNPVEVRDVEESSSASENKKENLPVQPASRHGNPVEILSLEETSSASKNKKENIPVRSVSRHGNPVEVKGVEETSSASGNKKENVPVQSVSPHGNPVEMKSLEETSSVSKNKKENVLVEPISRHGNSTELKSLEETSSVSGSKKENVPDQPCTTKRTSRIYDLFGSSPSSDNGDNYNKKVAECQVAMETLPDSDEITRDRKTPEEEDLTGDTSSSEELVIAMPKKRKRYILYSSDSESDKDEVIGDISINKISESPRETLDVQKSTNEHLGNYTKEDVSADEEDKILQEQMSEETSSLQDDLIEPTQDIQNDNTMFEEPFQEEQQTESACQEEVNIENSILDSMDKLDRDVETVQEELKRLREKFAVLVQIKRKYYEGTDENITRSEKRRRLVQKRDVFVEAKKMLNEKMLEEKEVLRSFLKPPYLQVYM